VSSLYFSLQNSFIQTWLTQKVAGFISEKLQAKVSIQSVDIEFFKTIVLEGVYVEDQNQDTLTYVQKLKASLELFAFSQNTLFFDEIFIEKPKFYLSIQENEETINLQFIINAFSSKDTTTSEIWDINFNSIIINDGSFSYNNFNYPEIPTGIDFSHIQVNNLNTKITNLKIDQDTVFADIDHLSLIEKSGFVLNRLSAKASVNPIKMDFHLLDIQTPHSEINTNFAFVYEGYSDFSEFIEKVRIQSFFNPSKISFTDLAFFSSDLEGIDKEVNVSGEVRGTIDHLKGKRLYLSFGEHTSLIGNVNITGLPSIDETYLHIDVDQLITHKKDLEKIPLPPFKKGVFLKIPDNVNHLGLIKFKGTFSGFFNDFVAYGNFNTNLGNFSSDIALRIDTASKETFYKGFLSCQNFHAGKFFEINEIGPVSLNANINGSGFTKDDLSATLKGKINKIEANRYIYKNITVEGKVSDKLFEGLLSINDPNLELDFNGTVNFKEELPHFEFASDIRIANLSKLNILARDSSSSLSTNMILNFSGDRLDNIVGNIYINDLTYKEKNKIYTVDKIKLLASELSENKRSLRLRSDLAEAEIKGIFSTEYLPSSLADMFNSIISEEYKPKTPKDKIQDFTFDAHLKNFHPITELFLSMIKIDPDTRIYGSFNSGSSNMLFKCNSPLVEIYGIELKDFQINSHASPDKLALDLGCKKLLFSDSLFIENFIIDTKTRKDSMFYSVLWDNHQKIKTKAEITGNLFFNSLTNYNITINPSQVFISDSVWSLHSDGIVNIDSNEISLPGIIFNTNDQSIQLSGNITSNPKDKVFFDFLNFNLGNLNFITSKSGIKLDGTVNGQANLTDIYHDVLFNSSLNIQKLILNNELLGDGVVSSVWNSRNKSISFESKFFRGAIPTIDLSGFYFPEKEKNKLDMTLKLEKLQLQILDEYLKDYVSDLFGLATGEIKITGEPSNPLIRGRINLQRTKFTINYLNTSYSLAHDVFIEHNKIYFENMTIYDHIPNKPDFKPNKAEAKGLITHNNFKDFHFDINILPKNFLCLNTTEKQNPLYYGTVFMTGKVNIKGPVDQLAIDINAKSERGTTFNIPLTGTEEIAESSFISFISKDSSSVKIKDDYQVNLSGIQLKFELDVTPDAEVQVIFDPKVGDIMRGKGSGHLTMEINTLGNFSIFGEFGIEEGDYLFTLMNVINKRFKVEKGGTIIWAGDPYNAKLNMNAIYRLRTSLMDLEIDTTRKRIPVNVVLKISDDLLSPDIKFDINLPVSDENTRTQLKTIISNEQELNQQVFALLSLNRFVPPLNRGPQQSNYSHAGIYATNSSELLSNQLSNWLSQISNEFDIGVNYRPGDDITNEELEIALSTQLLNDRVIIDGNLGVVNNQANLQQQNNLMGDFNIEYKLSDDGRIRIKGFNRQNNINQIYSKSPYTQGFGMFYRVEFNSFGELANKYKNRLRKKNKIFVPDNDLDNDYDLDGSGIKAPKINEELAEPLRRDEDL
jgi:hypothetical protein